MTQMTATLVRTVSAYLRQSREDVQSAARLVRAALPHLPTTDRALAESALAHLESAERLIQETASRVPRATVHA